MEVEPNIGELKCSVGLKKMQAMTRQLSNGEHTVSSLGISRAMLQPLGTRVELESLSSRKSVFSSKWRMYLGSIAKGNRLELKRQLRIFAETSRFSSCTRLRLSQTYYTNGAADCADRS